ncbi:MAG: hypothetical protein LBE62_11040 [Azonexus sp.]|jgi:hypothetical protein|nr:hypothetical protein [Azonexus sp.]
MGHILAKIPNELPVEELGKAIGLKKIKRLPYEYESQGTEFLGYLGNQQVIVSDYLIFRDIPTEYTIRLTVTGRQTRGRVRTTAKLVERLKAAGFPATEWPIPQPGPNSANLGGFAAG